MAGAGVIGMAVGDDGPIDGAQRVDIEATGDDVEAFRPYLGPGLGVWGRHEAKSWAADAGGQPPDRITRCPAAPSARDIPRVPNAIRLAREDRKSTRLNSSH